MYALSYIIFTPTQQRPHFQASLVEGGWNPVNSGLLEKRPPDKKNFKTLKAYNLENEALLYRLIRIKHA